MFPLNCHTAVAREGEGGRGRAREGRAEGGEEGRAGRAQGVTQKKGTSRMETLKSDLIAEQSAYTLKKPKTSYGR